MLFTIIIIIIKEILDVCSFIQADLNIVDIADNV